MMPTLVPEQDVQTGTNTDEVLVKEIILVHCLMKERNRVSVPGTPSKPLLACTTCFNDSFPLFFCEHLFNDTNHPNCF